MTDVTPINAPNAVPPPLHPGDPVPWFRALSDARDGFNFSSLGGRRLVLTFLQSMSSPEGKQIVADLLAGAKRFEAFTTGLVIVSADPKDVNEKVPDGLGGMRFLFDPDRTISKTYGLVDEAGAYKSMSFIVDERLRVVAYLNVRDAATHAASVFEVFDKLTAPPAFIARPQAPVLMIPNVFEPALCKYLIDGYEQNGGFESGYMVERNGMTVQESDPNHKRRNDWIVTKEEDIGVTNRRVRRRIVPEIQRAFQFHVSRIERHLVACYAGDNAGHFAAHRDNTTRGTAHRRFAVSVNLNDDYEGGELMFKEFGHALFKPPAGGACVFSCSLMHEARPVKSGKRYVFVPFLYDDAARDIRAENLKFLAPEE